MPTRLSIENFLLESTGIPVADVRSPAEFAGGHIPGAFNIPLFTNEERAAVGTIYKQQGNEAAVLKGLEFVGPKMTAFILKARENAPGKKIAVHCWRGGMRSASMAWLFETAGMEVLLLSGGYKAYRNFVLSNTGRKFDLRVVGGETGSGKTDILHELARKGEQVLDLEGLARHKGSSYGAIGQDPQPTVEQFENDFVHALTKLDPSRPVWIEDESRS
ncbi:MAG TPA: tRNA 2-selenouridine(34) synthase MnmH, partial [Bacteroidia bacterium]|nr:tRNA 2-selenouridine(34) synthase MnmH [Bacteroidia bacterium]